ncbi:MAG TPA: inositol monophosphatase [Anaerolineaceae bacterium]|nr:inositol monophosphatase [Anaerolineaceae bacterium]
MRTVILGSTNPVKVAAVQRGFAAMFPGERLEVRGIDVPSGVSAQPLSDAETLHGARKRAQNAREQVPMADFWVGIEGGVETLPGEPDALLAFAWVVVLSAGQAGCARTGAFVLPADVAKLVRSGIELGEADDQVFGTQGSKQQNGAVGLLTHDALTRAEFYAQAVQLALIPFINPQLYPASLELGLQ